MPRLPQTLGGHRAPVTQVAMTQEGKHAVSVAASRTLVVWDLERGQAIARFDSDDALYACTAAADGRTFVAGGASGRVHILRLMG